MPDDLLTVLLCELGERLLAMREALDDPAVTAKSHTRSVATLLGRRLNALEEQIQRDLLADPGDHTSAALLAGVDLCSRALRVLHGRLGLLERRWSPVPVDIALHKLRDDAGTLPRIVVVLSDDYDNLPVDVDRRLHDDLAALSSLLYETAPHDGEAVLSLPRIEAVNPLAWPVLFPALARFLPGDDGLSPEGQREGVVAARFGGPAAFAACAVHALLTTSATAPAWRAQLQVLARAGDIETPERDGARTPVALFERLMRQRDALLGYEQDGAREPRSASTDERERVPGPVLPAPDEVSALLAKLADGIPINAIDPPVPSAFLEQLDTVDNPADFYRLIAPLGERPASLATILSVGWLYKVRYSYPLFRDLLQSEASIGAALAAYRPHMIERNELLLQSIEAAHVQNIFVQGRMAE